MWCHLPTYFRPRLTLRFAALGLLIIALFTTLLFPRDTFAADGINKTLSFQGRLLRSSGGVVPDGNYNIQFKIYENGSGTATGNPDGTLKWTESYINNNGSEGVEVRNGIMSVNLGSKTPFGSSIDWNEDTLWLSLNIAGSAASCTTFGSGSCLADGEMLPMKRLTSSPYAMNAGAVGGKEAGQLVQLGQGTQIDATGSNSIAINKIIDSGDFMRLQSSGVDIFRVNNIGDVTLGNTVDHTLSVADSTSSTNGKNLVVRAGNGGSGSGSSGGSLILKGGNGGGTNGNGSTVTIDGGSGTGTGNGGDIHIGTNEGKNILIGSTYRTISQNILIGSNATAGSSTNVLIGSGSGASSGYTSLQAKNDVIVSTNGVTRAIFDTNGKLTLGNDYTSTNPTGFTIQGTQSGATGVKGGALTIQGGQATTGNADGGNISITGGQGAGTGVSGLVVLNTPTFSTAATDANCYASGANVAASCTVTAASVNNFSSVITGFTTIGRTATLPDPTNKTAGRIFYVMSSPSSQPFTLSLNAGGNGNLVTMAANTATTLMWNGADWVVTGTSSASAVHNSKSTDGFNLQVGDGVANGSPTLLTLDKASSAPTISDSALLGSMYYDTTLGKLQCYEASGWGSCTAKPDTFVNLSPEFSNAVINGAGTGTMTTNFCSDTLNVNDGSSSQATVCGTNETANYYQWAVTSGTNQSRNIYVNYQLPSNFKSFVSGSTSLRARTSATNSTVSYQIYRSNASGETACGTATTASTGTKTTWATVAAAGTADPSNCSFTAGDKLLIRINTSASAGGNAYVGDLKFAFSNN